MTKLFRIQWAFAGTALLIIFYFGKAGDMGYWEKSRKRCDGAGVKVGMIMCDVLGNLGDADTVARRQAVDNHYP